MFDRVIERAVEIFRDEDIFEGNAVTGSLAWGRAVASTIHTRDEAVALALDIDGMPQFEGTRDQWECEGEDNLFKFLRSAFYGMGLVFEPVIIERVGSEEYSRTVARRSALVNA
jgi:hypothetical protein